MFGNTAHIADVDPEREKEEKTLEGTNGFGIAVALRVNRDRDFCLIIIARSSAPPQFLHFPHE